ncbi:putative quinol monooxygenase [Mangrovibacillus cuniculi]|uniref:Antibiotic biosynthesis monooxygenase n=1 Tax=Mangrovibacillus cuniculi TaxID=2593652 RepID=A0A7S8C962_9BACI|nr:putative quinol monooxygenase [Mangrovibacillus cuniculi]QPC45657.1 antibiotic biosynthesis monooxygenase [Mangrovibacillus cuniculi]
MTNVVITAVLKAKPGKEAEALAALQEVVTPSREEEGCMTYQLHQSLEDISTFVFYEVWKDAEAVQKHVESAHYVTYREKAAELFEDRTVYKLAKV